MNPIEKTVTEHYNQLLILKARPTRVAQMESRLNKKLSQISSKLVKRVINDPIVNPARYDDRVREMYKSHLAEVYKVGEYEILKHPEIKLSQSPTSINRYESIIDNRVFNASETTMNRLKGDVLSKIETGIQEGRSYGNTAKELQTEFTEMTDKQLMRISRTETHSVYNQAKQETINNSIAGWKEWVSSGLENSRPAHDEANGQIVPVDEPFIVDGEELMYPGDPSGSPENVINCACTMVPNIRGP